jgi:hypothetical protein
MTLQTVTPPERGSLSVVYACPECGYEMAMLTNAYETQIVQSLGVRIGPEVGAESGPESGGGGASTSGTNCPFVAMIPAMEGAPGGEARLAQTDDSTLVRWTAGAEARLAKIPAFVRPMARTGIERFARERGTLEVDEQILDAARDFFGM